MKAGTSNVLVSAMLFLSLAVIAMCGVLAWSIVQQNHQLSHKASNAKVVHTLILANRNVCVATNITRATDNRSHLADYRLDLKVIAQQAQQIKFSKGTLHADYVALANVGISKKVLNRALRQSLAQLKSSESALKSERFDAGRKTWTALTNCRAAPKARASLHVYQISQHRVPRAAMSTRNALRLVPKH